LQILGTLDTVYTMNRDEMVEIFEVDQFRFNEELYSEIHLSITHINFDKNGNKRSNFKVEQVLNFSFLS
jgi:hypothetical protein